MNRSAGCDRPTRLHGNRPMAKYDLIVLTNPAPGREDDYNDWYTNMTSPMFSKFPGSRPHKDSDSPNTSVTLARMHTITSQSIIAKRTTFARSLLSSRSVQGHQIRFSATRWTRN